MSNKYTGLSQQAAKEKLAKDGYNELPSSKRRNIFKIIVDVFKEPMFLLLVSCGAVYFLLGDTEEAIMLLGFVFIVMGLTIYQENKTESSLDALKNLASPRALVIRDGEAIYISARELVVDDLVIVKEGDRVPADMILLEGLNVMADESLLTGESVPVRKLAAQMSEKSKPGGDDLPCVFCGSLITQGQGTARVFAIGMATEIGKIGKSLQEVSDGETFLQKEAKTIVKTVFIIAVILSVVIFLIYGFWYKKWLIGILSGLTLAMSILPEEIPVILTVFLAVGAWRISQKKVLARKMSAVETLGSATVLCVDKTGTLTQNKMTVKKIFIPNQIFNIEKNNATLPDKCLELIEFGNLASKCESFDPIEKAIKIAEEEFIKTKKHFHDDWVFEREYPLSSEFLSVSNVWKSKEGDYSIAAKGSPEAIIDLCHLPAEQKKEIEKQVEIYAQDGLRILGVARANLQGTSFPKSQHDFDFIFLGLIAVADPIRENVAPAIAECYQAGIRVIMLTGDYPITAKNIGRQIGLKNSDEVITGSELEAMPLDELEARIKTVNIFARMVPEQKLKIINALKFNGEIVAMTGDGVNDAPALKAADIGIAMGEKGTDVAREASDLVLIEDDFSCIVAAVREGRRTFDNLKKAMSYVISVHIPIAGMAFLPVLFGWPVILHPMHIVLLELIIDPACAIVFEAEPEEKDIMNRPPRNPKEKLFQRQFLLTSFVQGLFCLIISAFLYKILLTHGDTENEARTIVFTTLIISNLALIQFNRSRSKNILSSIKIPNKTFNWILIGATAMLTAIISQPQLRKLFYFSGFHFNDFLTLAAVSLLNILLFKAAAMLFRVNEE